ncbi:hypothetical protein [Oceanidesulfovibrio marinus]|uniref:Uncharacterized protein n=1 Tax=Oceanidesulfovibrio marinus TaxID=370038 RepID=A0A6P1ZIR6_9BACT|nr:hypothetical protein [Oceanidesulfovibrio marinus]TVM35262.1 hypothetical protein DQK91_06230 [Oceanidesulfovibrio marinus]
MVGLWFLYWLILVPIAIANGAARELTFGKRLPELRAHQLSTLTGTILFAVYYWILSFFWQISSYSEAFTIGLFWLALTVLFEFVFGHYVLKHPWSRLLADYNLARGRLWVLVLIWTFLGPAMVRGFSLLE